MWTFGHHRLLPTDCSFHAMAYDTQRKQVVLFGGISPTHEILGDTWVRSEQ